MSEIFGLATKTAIWKTTTVRSDATVLVLIMLATVIDRVSHQRQLTAAVIELTLFHDDIMRYLAAVW